MRKGRGKRHKRSVRRQGAGSHLVSRRYCLRCRRMGKFLYNRKVGHSECTTCGWRFIGGDVA